MQVYKIQGPNIPPTLSLKAKRTDNSEILIKKTAGPSDSKKIGLTGPSRETSATLSTVGAAEEFSLEETAFMTLLGLEPQDYQKLKKPCNLKEEDEIGMLFQKVAASSEKSEVVQKAKENIAKYQEYLKYKNEILEKIFIELKSHQKEIDGEINQLLARGFTEALKSARGQKVYREYFSILDKYQIKDPLNISLDELRKKGLSIYEETILKNQTEAIKILSLSYLSFEELQKYLDFTEARTNYLVALLTFNIQNNKRVPAAGLKSLGLSDRNLKILVERLFQNPREETLILKPEIRENLADVLSGLVKEKVITEELKKNLEPILKEFFLRGDYTLVRQREVAVEEMLGNEDNGPKFFLKNLAAQTKNVFLKYHSAVLELKKALATPETEDDKAASSKLAQIKEELVEEIKKEYHRAFEETPTEPEKQALKILLLALAQLKVNDERIIYYTRLCSPFLKDDERTEISRLKAADLSAEGKNKIRANLLEHYRQLSEEFFKNYSHYFDRRLTERKGERANALSYALMAAGISEAELLKIDSTLAEKYLSPDIKKLIDDKKSDQEKINFCLEEIKKISELLEKGTIGRELLKKYWLDYDCLSCILNNLVGSEVTANYLVRTKVFNVTEGARIISQFEAAQYTPEKTDDVMMQEELQKFRKLYPETDLFNNLELLRLHILARKILKEPIDESFINNMLDGLNVYGNQYDLVGFHKLLLGYLLADADEYTLKKKPHTAEAKEKILNWLKNFIQNTRNEIQKNPDYAGSEKMGGELGILGQILNTVYEMKIIDEEEFGRFGVQNPLIPASRNFSLSDLKKGRVFHTVGYQDIPDEIKKMIEQAGLKVFCEDHKDLLNIYWVPYENTSFLGYATIDKNTIVITYNRSNPNKIDLAAILVHELTHKVDKEAIRKYRKQNPQDSEFTASTLPLITERNAYLVIANFLNALKSSQQSGKIQINEEELKYINKVSENTELPIKTANFLLGFKDDDHHLLQPPFSEINLFSQILLINPADISFEEWQVLSKVLDRLGYKDNEKKYLLECGAEIFSGGSFDLNNFTLDYRYLPIDFLGKLINYEKTNDRGKIFTSKTGGFVNEDLLLIIKGIRQSVQEKLSKILQENIQKLQNPAISDDEKQVLERQNQELEQQIKILSESPATLIPKEIFRLILFSYYNKESQNLDVKK